ncbi:MAG: bifunctional folylpolyglutamate synthase/dihydrofolate synthase [Candidatus Goldiibacteriota bacterium]
MKKKSVTAGKKNKNFMYAGRGIKGKRSGIYDYIDSLNEFVFDFSLERIKKTLVLAGSPQNSFDVIHIAGSNGKGSVAAFLAQVLCECGYKTGLYTSPHIKNVRERIVVKKAGVKKNLCPEELFERNARFLKKLIEKNQIKLTYFEFLTVLSFLVFREADVRIAVVETGLGGRLDATNVSYAGKVLSIITSISKEHTRILGSTLLKILKEKEKITEKGDWVVNLNRSFLKKHMIKNGRRVVFADEKWQCRRTAAAERLKREYIFSGENDEIRLKTRMIENVQAENLKTVLASIDVLRKKGFKIGNKEAAKGIEKAEAAGRLFYDPGGFFLSVAHNPAAIENVFDTLRDIYGKKKIVYVFSGLADKDFGEIFRVVSRAGRVVVILTKINNPRAAEIVHMQRYVEKYGIKYYIVEDNTAALEKAEKIKGTGIIAAGGSFYLAGAYMSRGI